MRPLLAGLGLAVCARLPRPAAACGAMFHRPGEMAEQRTFEAIFSPGDGQVQVDYKVIYQGGATEFGWVLPIPGAFLNLEDSTADFEALFAATNPELDLEEVKEGGCMAGNSKGEDGLGGGDDTGSAVDIVAQGFTGTYGYTVLEATDTSALVAWLDAHGWEMGASAEGLQAYVDEGGYQFVAVELAADHEGADDEEVYALPGIAIQYEGARVEWPARMARYGMDGLTHSILYVRGDQRARLSGGWTEVALPLVWDDGEAPDYLRYEAFPGELSAAGTERAFATVFAGPVAADVVGSDADEGWVTRFETLSQPDVHTADAVFAVDAGTEELRTLISNRGGCQKPEGALLLVLPGLGLLARRRLSRSSPRPRG